jgi:dextranase
MRHCKCHRLSMSLLVGTLLLLVGCMANTSPSPSPTPTLEALPMNSVEITAFNPDKATYKPGERVEFLITLTNLLTQSLSVDVAVSVKHLAGEITRLAQPVDLPPGGQQTFRLAWYPPLDALMGYGADLSVQDESGRTLVVDHTAFDVLEHWTQAPRYGFLTDFAPGRANVDETMASLVRYHINGLQFYDWMYRHDEYLTNQEPYRDPLGREVSRRTIDALIDAAHIHNIAAMPYTAIYGASLPFFEVHRDWALYEADGGPYLFGENFLAIMNPDPASPWTAHLMHQFTTILEQTDFDGIHLDQYGDPKTAYSAAGNRVDLAQVIPGFINLTHETVAAVRPEATVTFNCVNNWPIETVAKTRQDFIYIEVWPPHTLYKDLYTLIVEAQALSGGKPVVLAAYIDPIRARNARLADAVIFASGGYHIELGESEAMLADAYFPKYKPIGDELAAVMYRYYDFAVRYENVLSIGTRDTTGESGGKVAIEGVKTDPDRVYKKVWVITRRGEDFETISLINLLDIPSPEWNGLLLVDPTPLGELRVHYQMDREVQRVWLASPDFASPQAIPLEFSTGKFNGKSYVEFLVPRLEYWDLVVLE